MVQLMPLHPKPHHLLPHLNPDWFYLPGTGLPRCTCVPLYHLANTIKRSVRSGDAALDYTYKLHRAYNNLKTVLQGQEQEFKKTASRQAP